MIKFGKSSAQETYPNLAERLGEETPSGLKQAAEETAEDKLKKAEDAKKYPLRQPLRRLSLLREELGNEYFEETIVKEVRSQVQQQIYNLLEEDKDSGLDTVIQVLEEFVNKNEENISSPGKLAQTYGLNLIPQQEEGKTTRAA